jgi:hypothetical protein
MAIKICKNGHKFEKTSDCPVCPLCSSEEMKTIYGNEFPKIGAPAFRALQSVGITQFSQLTKFSEKELLELHGFGPRALLLLKDALKKRHKSLAQK